MTASICEGQPTVKILSGLWMDSAQTPSRGGLKKDNKLRKQKSILEGLIIVLEKVIIVFGEEHEIVAEDGVDLDARLEVEGDGGYPVDRVQDVLHEDAVEVVGREEAVPR